MALWRKGGSVYSTCPSVSQTFLSERSYIYTRVSIKRKAEIYKRVGCWLLVSAWPKYSEFDFLYSSAILLRQVIVMDFANEWSDINEGSDIKKNNVILWL